MHDIVARRAQFLARWLKRATELSEEERALKQATDPSVSAAVSAIRDEIP